MNTQNNTTKTKEWETIKLDKKVVARVRAHKEKTRIPIAAFFEEAATEKLNKLNGAK